MYKTPCCNLSNWQTGKLANPSCQNKLVLFDAKSSTYSTSWKLAYYGHIFGLRFNMDNNRQSHLQKKRESTSLPSVQNSETLVFPPPFEII